MGDLVTNNNDNRAGIDGVEVSLIGEQVGGSNLGTSWENVTLGEDNRYQDSTTSNYGRSYTVEGLDLTGSQQFNFNNVDRTITRESSLARRTFDLGPLGVNLPSSDAYSFDPWSRPASPLPPPAIINPNSSINPYESYPNPTSTSISNNPSTSNSILPHPSIISHQEHIWSRTNQEQQLALQQRQQREQLQLQLQQQDEWYHQEAYQRQQQEIHRLQQRMDGNRSYSVPAINSNNPYDYSTPSLNTSPYAFSNPSPISSLPSPMIHRNSSLNNNNNQQQRSSSTDANYSIDRDPTQFQLRSQSLSQPQTQSSYLSNYIPPNTSENQVLQREWSPGQNIPYLPLPATSTRQNQLPPPSTTTALSSSIGSPWNNTSESDYPTYLLPQNRQLNSNVSPPQSQLPLPPLNRLPSSNISPSPPFSSYSAAVNVPPPTATATSSSRNQIQQIINHKPRPVVETLRSGLPVVPDRSPFAMWTGNVRLLSYTP